MKKIFVAFCAVMIFAVVSCVALNSEDTGETHIHNHAYAAASFWRCRQCGMQATDHGSPPSEFGCDVSRNRQHIWEKLYAGGTRSVHWQCIKCGLTMFTSAIPSEFGCDQNKSRCHVWQRQD